MAKPREKGEGQPRRVRGPLGREKLRLSKVISSAPLYDDVIGAAADSPAQA
jgi:hypothetical protein